MRYLLVNFLNKKNKANFTEAQCVSINCVEYTTKKVFGDGSKPTLIKLLQRQTRAGKSHTIPKFEPNFRYVKPKTNRTFDFTN